MTVTQLTVPLHPAGLPRYLFARIYELQPHSVVLLPQQQCTGDDPYPGMARKASSCAAAGQQHLTRRYKCVSSWRGGGGAPTLKSVHFASGLHANGRLRIDETRGVHTLHTLRRRYQASSQALAKASWVRKKMRLMLCQRSCC
jgi:hypothetical protein